MYPKLIGFGVMQNEEERKKEKVATTHIVVAPAPTVGHNQMLYMS